ncbi:ty1-copia retrotransposon protein [Cucumis melo var. makuwa]|uniref:Ty1-copia retrotransposon protein n=1 Tax=Cucumis melo var. makuwa TaxID=1194695 RepID=A0A5D3CYX5_CUCMM|nr:ty1-copia retrotransposon protein [Cucumis melo var. makuwa]
MTDDKPIVEQIHEYENLVTSVLSEGMKMCEILQANVLLKKFPRSWNDYHNHLKRKKKDLKLQELIGHMCTEEANRLKDKDRTKQEKGHKGKNSEKRQFKALRGHIKKKKLVCYVCGKEGHKSYQRNQRKGRPSQKPTPQANLAEQDSEFIAVIIEANLIENKMDCILDTGVSRHFCTNRELLHDYEDTADGECVFIGNSTTAGVSEKGKVILKLTSGKILSLTNVLYVPSLRRNLVSGSLLNRAGLKFVLESDKVVLTKNGDFVGKGYLSNGLFVLNTIFMNANASSSAYVIKFVNLWHGRLGHVNFASIRKLKDLRLINTSELHETGKYPICAESKFHKKPFKPVESRTTDLILYELWKGHAPNLSYLKVWGCLAKVPFPALKKSTVGSKTFDCIFIGYAQNSVAYRFMCLNDKTINESRDAEFFEHVFPLKQSLSSISKRMHDPENPSIVSETPISEIVNTSNLRCELELRRSKRQRTEKSFGPDFLSTFIVERRDEIDCNFTNLYLIDEDPKTYQETLNFVESSMWKEAIKSELDSLVMNHTWDLVDLPMGNNPIRLRTPFNAIKHLKKNKGDSVSQLEYAKIIGSVMYLMNYTRPDIAYAVSRLSRYTHNPDRYHWDALRHLLRYLKGTIDYYLHFNKFPVVLEGYCDANRVTDNDEVNSTSGYIFLLGGRAISWKSAKQTCIARSTMES